MKRSLDQFAGVGSSLGHKNDMFCLPGVVGFFSRKVSFVVRPNIRMGSNAFNNLEGPKSPPPSTNPSLRMLEVIFRSFKKSKSSVTGERICTETG